MRHDPQGHNDQALPEDLLSAYLDDEVTANEQQLIDQALQSQPHSRELLAQFSHLKDQIQELTPPMPSAERWAAFDVQFESALKELDPPAKHGSAPLRLGPGSSTLSWLAAAAVLLGVSLVGLLVKQGQRPYAFAYSEQRRELRSFKLKRPAIAWPQAQAAAPAALSAEARQALNKHGLHIRGRRHAGLAQSYIKALQRDEPLLLTPELATLLHEGSLRRLLRSLEFEVLNKRLRRLLKDLVFQLQALRRQTGHAALHKAADHAIAIMATALRCAGDELPLQASLKQQVEAEVARIKAAKGPSRSSILGRPEDYRAYASRSPYRGDKELEAYERCIRWLSRAPLMFKEDRDCQAGALVVLAIARADQFAAWNDMQQLITLFFGEADDLNVFDMRRALQSLYGASLSKLDLLAQADFSRAFAEAMKAEHSVQKRGLVASVSGRGPQFRLFGGTRSADNLCASAVTGRLSARTERPRATSLDLPLLLGSKEAKRLLSWQEEYPQDLEAAAEAHTSLLSSRSLAVLEQARLKAAASLFQGMRFQGMRSAEMSERAKRRQLSAAIACLNARAPAQALSKKASFKTRARLTVEPQASFYARLAHAHREIRELAEDLAGQELSTGLIDDLKSVEELLRMMDELSLDQGTASRRLRAVRRELAQELARVLPAFERSSEWTVDVLNTVQYPGALDIQQRAVGGADELWRVLPGPSGPQAVRGYCFAIREHSGRQRLTPEDARTQASRPMWMRSWMEAGGH